MTCVPVVICSAFCTGLMFKPASHYLVTSKLAFGDFLEVAPSEFLVRTVRLSLGHIHVLERHMENRFVFVATVEWVCRTQLSVHVQITDHQYSI